MMNLVALVHSLRCSLLRIESRLLQAAGLDRNLGEFTGRSSEGLLTLPSRSTGRSPEKLTVLSPVCAAPALAVNGSSLLPRLQPQDDREKGLEERRSPEQPPGLLDGILWMAAPKKRRTIEVNRTRRRAESKLLKVKVGRNGPLCTDWEGPMGKGFEISPITHPCMLQLCVGFGLCHIESF